MTQMTKRFCLVAMIATAMACGDTRGPLDSAPTVSDPILAVPNAQGRDFIVFGDAALLSTKRVRNNESHLKESVEKEVRESKKATLKVKFPKYKSPVRVKDARFKVKKNSIGGHEPLWEDYHRIGMQVETGQSLSDIVVKFSPSGMTFSPVAKLTLRVIGDLDEEDLVAYHVSSNGKVTKPRFKAKKEKSVWQLEVEVPSFSRYTYDDDDRYSDEENPWN